MWFNLGGLSKPIVDEQRPPETRAQPGTPQWLEGGWEYVWEMDYKE
ncbi:hypothetical protein J2W83_002625 [Pseudomonas hunanensis]|uniref:Uncharacterized protein n=1 Tax=Pseudomonas hunanensis TaxID=1247546 RepID=A0ACC6K3H1_9PSED|nr:hypothetical protein [Pseudomonas hunanensis]